jgi:hypothetical protein
VEHNRELAGQGSSVRHEDCPLRCCMCAGGVGCGSHDGEEAAVSRRTQAVGVGRSEAASFVGLGPFWTRAMRDERNACDERNAGVVEYGTCSFFLNSRDLFSCGLILYNGMDNFCFYVWIHYVHLHE